MKCECGIELKDPVYPVYCSCGLIHGSRTHVRRTVCIHRGKYRGRASCKCGAIYFCNLLNKLCGNTDPIDEFVDLDGTLLNKENFQNCRKCTSVQLPV